MAQYAGRGTAFQISRSVRQGFSLVPYLFLFLAEDMGYYLHATDHATLDLSLPLRKEHALLDIDIANDTSMTIKGD